jgi:hypothetical protein
VKNETPTTSIKQLIHPSQYLHQESASDAAVAGVHMQASLLGVQRRYVSLALILSVLVGGLLIVSGLRPLGKGLILGTVFSNVNFILIAVALPARLRYVRGKAFLISITSIYARYALMALPLIWALKQETFALSTTAVGLFMVQFAILGDHLWAKLRNTDR